MPSSITRTYRRQAIVQNASAATILELPWVLAFGESTLRTALQLNAKMGNFGCRFSFRTASVTTTEPSPWSASPVGTNRTADGAFVEDINVAALVSNAMWIQPRIEGALTTGSGVAEAFVAARVAARRKGVVIGQREFLLQPTINSGANAYLPIGRPVSALDIDAMMFAFDVSGLTGTISYSPVFRTFAASADMPPSSWSANLATYAGVAADERRNSGALTVSPGTQALVQAGVRVSGQAIGTIRAMVAARYL